MANIIKIYYDVMCGSKDNNIRFVEIQKFLDKLGFEFRIKGDYFIYYKDGIEEIINIQPDGNKAKAYQVKQVRNLILKYRLVV